MEHHEPADLTPQVPVEAVLRRLAEQVAQLIVDNAVLQARLDTITQREDHP